MGAQNTVRDQFSNALAAKNATGQKFRVTDYLWQLVQVGQMAIDTPEERQAIEKGLQDFYDTNVGPHVPEAYAARTRAFIFETVDDTLKAAAAFHVPAPKAATE